MAACPVLAGCSVAFSISFNGVVGGLGGGVSFTDTPIYSVHYQYPYTCSARMSPGCIPPPLDDYPPDQGTDGMWKWDPTTCTLVWDNFGPHTPIIIDTDGSGFHFTSATSGIHWDFNGNGHPIQIAWTAASSTNGWLAIDLNGNGLIDSGKELFGNESPQPNSSNPNGFLALAVYDANGDGVIDKLDPVWPKLLVWIDTNHDGISQPGELHHLDDIGVHSISLRYSSSPYTDSFGNKFELKGHLNPDKDDNVNRVIYDVTLTTAK